MAAGLAPQKSTWIWNEAPQGLESFGSTGRQAGNISLVRRTARRPRAAPEQRLFVCKWYATSGVHPDRISGAKYIYREWQTVSSVAHPNIVQYVDFSYTPSGARMAKLFMEYCSAGDLSQFEGHDDERRLSCTESSQVLTQMAQALLYLHHGIYRHGEVMRLANARPESSPGDSWNPILHRDIKPANNGHIDVKLGDFGIAKFETEGTDTYVGSREFIAPEQRTSNADPRRTTYKSDIYALGGLECNHLNDDITPDKDAVTMTKITQRHDSDRDNTDSHNSSSFPRGWQGLLHSCMAVDDSIRPSSIVLIQQLGSPDEFGERTILGEIVEDILQIDAHASGGAHKRRKSKWKTSIAIEMCRRLLESGTEPSTDVLEVIFAASRGYSQHFQDLTPDGSTSSPAWKISAAKDLLLLLKKYDKSGTTAENLQRRQLYLETCLEKVRRAETAAAEKSLEAETATAAAAVSVVRVIDRAPRAPGSYANRIPPFSPPVGTHPADYFQVKGMQHEALYQQYQYLQLQQDALRNQLVHQQAAQAQARASDSSWTRSYANGPASSRFVDTGPPRTAPLLPGYLYHYPRNSPSEPSSAAAEGATATHTPDPSPRFVRENADAFKLFADNEKLRLQAAQEAKRNIVRQEKDVKLQDLQKFAANFKLKSRIPNDLVPFLAKDREKQRDIQSKAEEAAKEAELRVRDIPNDDKTLPSSSAMTSAFNHWQKFQK